MLSFALVCSLAAKPLGTSALVLEVDRWGLAAPRAEIVCPRGCDDEEGAKGRKKRERESRLAPLCFGPRRAEGVAGTMQVET